MTKRIAKNINAIPATGNAELDMIFERLRLEINSNLTPVLRKEYLLKVTGTNAIVKQAVALVEVVLDGSNNKQYWLDFNIGVELTTDAAGFIGYIDGVVFDADTAISYSDKDSADNLQVGYAMNGTNKIYGESSDTTTDKLFSGRARLRQKPDWYRG